MHEIVLDGSPVADAGMIVGGRDPAAPQQGRQLFALFACWGIDDAAALDAAAKVDQRALLLGLSPKAVGLQAQIGPEYASGDQKPKLHKEQLVFENVELSQRSYK